ncbi:MAG: hypothetical protein HQM12_18115 [SAR324 cluster bacterium]|nr:hypothetical protein [SAR324 cluster bacterium]
MNSLKTPHSLIQALLHHLPHYSEAGQWADARERSTLVKHLCQDTECSEETGSLLVGLVERMLNSVQVLDPMELIEGRWKWVSFPAQLMAHSLLSVWADPAQALLPQGFWFVDSARSPQVIEQQRLLLHQLEQQRLEHHATRSPTPIRFVYAVWAFIKLENRFLLYHREDRSRPEVSNFIPPGGRFHPLDLPQSIIQQTPRSQILEHLQSAQAEWVRDSLETTLKRTLQETTGLQSLHYQARKLWTLPPFLQVEGAQSNHAYTRFEIQVFHLQLNKEGWMKLLEYLASQPHGHFAWFTSEEMRLQQNSGGKKAYLQALFPNFESERVLEETLNLLEESYTDRYALGEPSLPVDLPHETENRLRYGLTGKEQTLPVELTLPRRQMLLALGWYARQSCGPTILPPLLLTEGVLAMPQGWLRVMSPELVNDLTELADQLNQAQFPLLEQAQQCYFRLSAAPSKIFWEASLFSYALPVAESGKGTLELVLKECQTPLGLIPSKKFEYPLSATLTGILEDIAQTGTSTRLADISKTIRDQLDQRISKPLGLRKLIREEEKQYRIVIPRHG